MKVHEFLKIFLVSGIFLFGLIRMGEAQEREQSEQTFLQQETPPLRSDEYPTNQDLTNQYPLHDPDTGFNFSQFPYYDPSTGYFIPGPLEKQDPNFPVEGSVVNQFPYYDASSEFFIYGPLETIDPNIPIPDPDAMPLPLDYATPNTDGWNTDAAEPNIANPNISTPNLPIPNIAKPNVDPLPR